MYMSTVATHSASMYSNHSVEYAGIITIRRTVSCTEGRSLRNEDIVMYVKADSTWRCMLPICTHSTGTKVYTIILYVIM